MGEDEEDGEGEGSPRTAEPRGDNHEGEGAEVHAGSWSRPGRAAERASRRCAKAICHKGQKGGRLTLSWGAPKCPEAARGDHPEGGGVALCRLGRPRGGTLRCSREQVESKQGGSANGCHAARPASEGGQHPPGWQAQGALDRRNRMWRALRGGRQLATPLPGGSSRGCGRWAVGALGRQVGIPRVRSWLVRPWERVPKSSGYRHPCVHPCDALERELL